MTFTLLDNTIHSPSDLMDILNESLRKARFMNKSIKAALFTIWTDDTAGAPIDIYICTGTYAATLVAATETDAAAGRPVRFTNDGAGTITVTPDGSDTISGAGTLALSAGDSATLLSDGTSDWISIG